MSGKWRLARTIRTIRAGPMCGGNDATCPGGTGGVE